MTFLDEETREKFMQILSPKEIAEKVIDNLDSDDAADIISELPEEKQREVLSEIEDYEQAKDIADLLNYNEDTAGGLMGKELVKVNLNSSLCNACAKSANRPNTWKTLFAVYVVDDRDVLFGRTAHQKPVGRHLPRQVGRHHHQRRFGERERAEKGERVAEIMRKYDLVVLPVVDGLGRLG